MRVLVTGGTGFFGSHIVRALLGRSHEAVAGIRRGTQPWRLDALAPDVEKLEIDLTWPAERQASLLQDSHIEAVVHAAGYGVDYRQSDFETGMQVNVFGGRRLVLAAKRAGCTRILHVGTSMEFGPHGDPVREDFPLEPTGTYGVTKACSSVAIRDAARSENMDVAIVRPWGLYGPLEGAHKFVPIVMAAAREGRNVNLTPGEQLRDYVYVEDAAVGVSDLICRVDFPAGETFNFGSGKTISLRTLGEAAVQAAGGATALLNWGGLPYRSDEVMIMASDQAKTHTRLGWAATTSLVDGMKRTAAAVPVKVSKA